MRYLLEYTPGEIAEALELPRGTVNSRLRRALDRLQSSWKVRGREREAAQELLRETPVPEEREAQERGWRVVRAALEARHPVPARLRLSRLAIALAVGLLIAAIALSPAGAKVADIVHDVVQPGAHNARPALTSLPARGRLLVTSPKGPWIVDQDGSKRLLGAYEGAAWSPHGLFAAVTRGRELTAVDPVGTVRWSLAARPPGQRPGLVDVGSPSCLPQRLLPADRLWRRNE